MSSPALAHVDSKGSPFSSSGHGLSSRVIIKNLPKYITKDRLRTLFEKKGKITDIKLANTVDGKFRRFAFIGFQSEKEAKIVSTVYHNTYIDTCKISCELARSFGDPHLPRPWSRYSKGSSAYLSSSPDSGQVNKEVPLKVEQPLTERAMNIKIRFEEFFSDSEEEHTEKFQENTQPHVTVEKKTETLKHIPVDSSSVHVSTSAPLTPVPSLPRPEETILDTGRLFLRNLSYLCTEEDLTQLFSKYGPISEVHVVMDPAKQTSKGLAYVLFMIPEHAVTAYSALDGNIFQGRLLHILPAEGKEVVMSTWKKTHEKDMKTMSTFKDQRERERRDQAGSQTDRQTWNALFMNLNAVTSALAEKFKVSKTDLLDLTREACMQTEDMNTEDPVNLRHMRGVESMAVKMALAETYVIQATKHYLVEEACIHLDALQRVAEESMYPQMSPEPSSQPTVNHASPHSLDVRTNSSVLPRSRTTLLVKNIPYSTTQADLEHVFGRYGSFKRLILPPTRTLAIIEYEMPVSAKRAFRYLAYSKFKEGRPLYLEFAPVNLFDEERWVARMKNQGHSNSCTDRESTATVNEPSPTIETESTLEAVSEPNKYTLYVKNLGFSTTEEQIRTVVETVASPVSLRIAKKRDMNTPGQWLSMGFGFLELSKQEDAVQVLSRLQGVVVDGHAWQLKFARQTLHENIGTKVHHDLGKKPAASQTKLLLRNVPFEASQTELRELLSSFGTVRALRLPKKVMSGQHRGFAFVDYSSHQEAAHAMEQLKGTHLYARHLVIEWATETSMDQVVDQRTKGKLFQRKIRPPSARTINAERTKRVKHKVEWTIDRDGNVDS